MEQDQWVMAQLVVEDAAAGEEVPVRDGAAFLPVPVEVVCVQIAEQ